ESRDVEACVLFRRADSHGGEEVDDAQDHVRTREREGRYDDTGQGLDPELSRVPEEQPVRAARVDQGRGEKAARQGPPDAAGPVAGEDVDRVVERRPGPPA